MKKKYLKYHPSTLPIVDINMPGLEVKKLELEVEELRKKSLKLSKSMNKYK